MKLLTIIKTPSVSAKVRQSHANELMVAVPGDQCLFGVKLRSRALAPGRPLLKVEQSFQLLVPGDVRYAFGSGHGGARARRITNRQERTPVNENLCSVVALRQN